MAGTKRFHVTMLAILAISGWMAAIGAGLYISREDGRTRSKIDDVIGNRNNTAISLCDKFDKIVDYSNNLRADLSKHLELEARLIPIIGSENTANSDAAQLSDSILAYGQLKDAVRTSSTFEPTSQHIQLAVIDPAQDRCAHVRGIITSD